MYDYDGTLLKIIIMEVENNKELKATIIKLAGL